MMPRGVPPTVSTNSESFFIYWNVFYSCERLDLVTVLHVPTSGKKCRRFTECLIVDLYEHFERLASKTNRRTVLQLVLKTRAERHSDQTIVSCCSCRPVSPSLSVMARMCSSAPRGHFNTRHDIIVIIGRAFAQFKDSSRFGPSETLQRVGEHPGSFCQVSPF